MRTYKDYQKWIIGGSDIASLLLLGCHDNGAEPMMLNFGSDGCYHAYIIPENVEIGKHYNKVTDFKHWLKIYDDCSLVMTIYAQQINVYRAGDFGCIIQIIKPQKENYWFIEELEDS